MPIVGVQKFRVEPRLYIYLIDLIENVKRIFAKRMPSISSLSCPERFAILDLDLLEL
jgi:hypothetical protein